MPRQEVTLKTRDGTCPASVFTPGSPGTTAAPSAPWPGVLFLMDGGGIRPAMWDMGQRLADAGYLVLLPDLYYRMGPYPPMDPPKVFADPKAREGVMKLISSLNRDRKISDATAFVDYLAARPDVQGRRFGVTGYCMGGNYALTVAAALPERFAAIASFHGGRLATDQPDSPHLFVKNITARVYVAGAIEDNSFPDDQKALLEKSLTDAGVNHLIETYPARHGFAVHDFPVYDAGAAERHWQALFQLFGETLKRGRP